MSLLWLLHPPSGKSSWLFGTMHIRDQRVYSFCQHLYPLIRNADAYIGEMNLDDRPERIALPSYALRHHFRTATYIKMRHQIQKSFGLDLEHYHHLHPMMILSAISHRVLQSDHTVSLDEHLWSFAGEQHLPLSGLETGQEQMQLLHTIEPEPLYRQLRQLSTQPHTVRKFTDKVLQLYLKQDIHGLYRMTKSSLHHLRKPIIYRRNQAMVDRINTLDRQQSSFITVGAGHLSGPYGLIAGLRAKGWRVRPDRAVSGSSF